MKFRRPSPLEEEAMEVGPGETVTKVSMRAAVPLRAAGLPEKNTFIQFPQERSAVVAPVGAFTTPANLAPNLGTALSTSLSPSVHVFSPSPMMCSPGSSASPLRTPSTMCGSPVNLHAYPAPQQPAFVRCVSDPTGGMDPSMNGWQHYAMAGQQLSPMAPAFQPQMAPLAQNRMAPGPLITGPKLPPGALRGAGASNRVTDRPYLLPAPMLPAVPVPAAPRVLKFSYTVPGQAPAVPMKMGEGIENNNNNY